MSLVNLSHVCSHLQNASLARLGLTSIPYSRLHLSLSLLLQKQGFLSQVKLAGHSPPASCFPPGMRDNHHVTSHPHFQRRTLTPERALHSVVRDPTVDAERLRNWGYEEEAVEFAMEKREKSKAQLERDGWAEVAAQFLLRHGNKSMEQMQSAGLSESEIAIIQQYRPMLEACKAEVEKWTPERWDSAAREGETQGEYQTRVEQEYRQMVSAYTQSQLPGHIIRSGFDVETLRCFAGPERYLSPNDLALNGVTINAMGLEIEDQPITQPPMEQYTDDIDDLETEGVVTQANRASRRLWLGLKYWDGMPVLAKARMVSKPKKRIWLTAQDIGKLTRGMAAGEVKPLTRVGEIMAVKTERGILEARECVERKLGGMPLCRIW